MKNTVLKKLSLLIVFFLVFTFFVKAVPADPRPLVFTQPDNTELTVFMKGDEYVSWAETKDGYTILYSEEIKGYVYAIAEGDAKKLVRTLILAHNPESRSAYENSFILSNVGMKNLRFNDNQIFDLRKVSNSINKSTATVSVFPTLGKKKSLCILIGFNNKPFRKANENFDNLFNQVGYTGDNGSTGSVKDYYLAASQDKFELEMDVVGPFISANDVEHYAQNYGDYKDIRFKELVEEALIGIKDQVNFADYDNDGDGWVDAIAIIFAGYSEASHADPTTSVWPHAGYLNRTLFLDGVRMNRYFCASELDGTYGDKMANIGVFCHEFGHVLGLPDYYDTDYDKAGGQGQDPGSWSLMASGPYLNGGKTPPLLDGYSMKMLNWCNWVRLDQSQEVKLLSRRETDTVYYMETPVANEFFFMENRQRNGWDTYLPGHGMLIYHVDRNYKGWGTNDVNSVADHQAFDIEEANDNYSNFSGHPFPGTSNKTSFTDGTTPNSKTWSKQNIGKPITNISESEEGIITFYFMGEPTIKTLAVNNISSDSAVCSGKVLNYGTGGIVEMGICWAEQPNIPYFDATATTTKNTVFVLETDTTIYTSNLKNLEPNKKYNVRAYALTDYGKRVGYGEVFAVQANPVGTSVLLTEQVTNIDTASADVKGNIISVGATPNTEVGFCWSKDNALPTITDSSFSMTYTTDDFSTELKNLSPGILYHVRAYAKNAEGIAYGNTLNFYTAALPIRGNKINFEDLKDSIVCQASIPAAGFIETESLSGGSGIFTYTWQQSYDTIDWSNASGIDTTSAYKPSTIALPTYFRRVVFSGANSDTSNIITIKIDQPSIGGKIVTLDTLVTQLGQPIQLELLDHVGKIERWQKRAGGSTNWPTDGYILKDTNIIVDTLKTQGTWQFLARVKNGVCPAVISEIITVAYTSIDEIDKNNYLKIYPNPNNGIFTLELSRGSLKRADMVIADIQGKTVYQKSAIDFGENKSQQIDLSVLPNGVYFIRITDKENSFVQKVQIIK